jgi:hypothetical protein
MYKVPLIGMVVLLLFSCSTSQEMIQLHNGKTVTRKKFDRIVRRAMKDAEKSADEQMKERLTRKEYNQFEDYMK